MTRFDKRLIGGLDAAAEKTGIPALAMGRARRRRFRWLPIVALLLGFGGYVAMLAQPQSIILEMGFGPAWWALYVAMMLCSLLQVMSPLQRARGEVTDEFDRALHMRSYFVALGCVALFAFVALLLIAGLALLLSWTRESLVCAVIATALMLQVIGVSVATLYASWKLAPAGEEED